MSDTFGIELRSPLWGLTKLLRYQGFAEPHPWLFTSAPLGPQEAVKVLHEVLGLLALGPLQCVIALPDERIEPQRAQIALTNPNRLSFLCVLRGPIAVLRCQLHQLRGR